MSTGYHIEDEAQERPFDRVLMWRLFGYIRPYRRQFIVATCLLLVAALLSNLIPLFTMRAIDSYIDASSRGEIEAQLGAEGADQTAIAAALEAERAANANGLVQMVLIIGALLLAEGFIRYGQLVIVAFVGQKTMLEMRMDIFAHLQRMSLRFLDRNPVGRLMTRVTSDVEKIQETIVTGMVQVISDFATLFVVIGFMVWVNWQLALITFSTVPFVFFTSWLFRKYARQSYLEIRRKLAHLNAYLQENISGMRIVQLFGREDANYEEYRQRNADHRDEWFRQVRNYALYFPVIDFLGTLAVALIIFFGGHQILQGVTIFGGPASIGLFFAYVQWAERLFEPVRALADRYNLILEAMASSERIFALLDTPEDITDRETARDAAALQGAIAFEQVWFAYDGTNWVAKDIDFAIAPGERVAIVGYTGAGKTTLVNLLARFYDVQRGRIAIDGVDVRDYKQADLRRNIGIVLQDVFMFSGSVDENIRLGNEALSDERIRACAEYVNAAKFIERLPGGFQYDVGERGCNLSTGQRQLLAFARTLAHDPRILVLDEATSSVDTETEALIQDAIAKLMEGRTSIVIAHRLSTVQHADRIIVMHHGEVREMGNHQQLLAQRGLYYRLYQLQYRDQAPAA